ncbi:EF-hand calcium-binding domain-containing protein 5, partial [Nowakowskiella sp. JEL0078]
MCALTNEFLNVDDDNLDNRYFLLQASLPTVVLALEKLLREVVRLNLHFAPAPSDDPMSMSGILDENENIASLLTKIANPDLADPPNIDRNLSSAPASRVNEISEDQNLAPAAEELNVQIDKPLNSNFDPINWLAQFLYRNNPRYMSIADGFTAPYLEAMSQICIQLKSRCFELESNIKAQQRAEQIAAQKDEECHRMIQNAQLAEKKRQFTELILTAFRKWTSKMIQSHPFILHSEMIESVKRAKTSESIQATETLTANVAQFHFCLVLDIPPKFTPALYKVPDYEINNDIIEDFSGSSNSNEVNFETLQIWDQSGFTEMMLSLTESWNLDELTVFLQCLLSHAEHFGMEMKYELELALYFPTLQEFEDLSIKDTAWVQLINRYLSQLQNISTLKLTDEDFSNLMSSWRNFEQSDSCSKEMNEKNWSAIDAEFKIWTMKLATELGIKAVIRILRHIRNTVMNELENVLKNTVRITTQSRKNEIEEIFKMLAPEGGDVLVRKMNGSIDILLGSVPEVVPGKLMDVVAAVKFPVMARTLMTKRINKVEFVDHVFEQTRQCTDTDFKEIMSYLKQAVFGNNLASETSTHENLSAESKTLNFERSVIERKVKESIRTLNNHYDWNVSDICSESLNLITSGMTQIHADYVILGRVSLLETSAAKQFLEAQAIHEKSIPQSFLRYVACSNEFRENYFGAAVYDEKGVDFEVIQKSTHVNISDFSGYIASSTLSIATHEIEASIKGRYMAVPMLSTDNRAVGVLGLNMKVDDPSSLVPNFDEADVKFIQDCAKILMKVIEKNDSRQKATVLAESALKFIQEKGENASIEIYLIENDEFENEKTILKVEDHQSYGIEESKIISPYMEKSNLILTALQNDDFTSKLWTAADNKQIIEENDNEKIIGFIIPVVNDQGVSVA